MVERYDKPLTTTWRKGTSRDPFLSNFMTLGGAEVLISRLASIYTNFSTRRSFTTSYVLQVENAKSPARGCSTSPLVIFEWLLYNYNSLVDMIHFCVHNAVLTGPFQSLSGLFWVGCRLPNCQRRRVKLAVGVEAPALAAWNRRWGWV